MGGIGNYRVDERTVRQVDNWPTKHQRNNPLNQLSIYPDGQGHLKEKLQTVKVFQYFKT